MSFEVICCLGDSIANGYWDERGLGWFGRLQEKIAGKYPYKFGFNNLAQSGDRTSDVYHRLCSEALTREPDIVVIAVGCNDITRWEREDGPTDLSPQARHEWWGRLLKQVKQSGKRALVVGLIPSVEERYPRMGYDGETPMWQKNEDAKAYNAQIKRWVEAEELAFLDVLDDWLARDYASLIYDGGHPNGKGHELLAGQVLAKLENLGWVKSCRLLGGVFGICGRRLAMIVWYGRE